MSSKSELLIDVHHHIAVPEAIALMKAKQIPSAHMYPDWAPEHSIARMDLVGVAAAILSHTTPASLECGDQALTSKLARIINESAARMIQDYPTRCGAFATLPMPNVEASLKELEYALDVLGLDGVGLITNYGDLYLGYPEFEELYAELDRRHAVVTMHPTIKSPTVANLPSFLLEGTIDTTRAVTSLAVTGVLERYPNIKFIAPHTGGMVPYIKWRIAMACMGKEGVLNEPKQEDFDRHIALLDKQLYVDTAVNFGSVEKIVPSSQILFGTDSLYFTEGMYRYEKETVLNTYKDEDLTAVTYANALRLFPRLRDRLGHTG